MGLWSKLALLAAGAVVGGAATRVASDPAAREAIGRQVQRGTQGALARLEADGAVERRASGSAVLAEDTAQRGVDHRVPALPGMAQAAMLMGDRRQAAAQPAAAELAGQARQIGRDDHRLGRQRGHAAGGAPGGEVGPVGGIGAPRVVGQRPAGVARRLRHRLANRTGEHGQRLRRQRLPHQALHRPGKIGGPVGRLIRHAASHGFTSVAPSPSKSVVFRVARVAPWANAIPPISASARAMGRPAASRAARARA